MYRPPEMRDVRRRWVVGPQVDMWMAGCVLYALCYNTHPFLDKGRCAAVEGDYSFPSSPVRPDWLKVTIMNLLTPEPHKRSTALHLVTCLQERNAEPNPWAALKRRQFIEQYQW